MTKTGVEAKVAHQAGIAVPPLSPSVRRHLGKSLRSLYATALTEPVSERLEAVLARLDKKA